jgi:endoglucanase
MSYDAIRIPLYVAWFDKQSSLLTPWRTWFGQFSREQTPAWVNVTTNEYAPYMMEGGLLAVRDLTMGQASGEPEITTKMIITPRA